MTKSPTILTRPHIFRAGAGLAVAATATPLLNPLGQSEDARQPARNLSTAMASIASRSRLQATVISMAMGRFRSRPIFVMNARTLNWLRC